MYVPVPDAAEVRGEHPVAVRRVRRRLASLLVLGGITMAAIGVGASTSGAADAGMGPLSPPQQVAAGGLALRLVALQKTYTVVGDGAPLRHEIEEARRAEAAEQAAMAAEPDSRQRLRMAIGQGNHAPRPLAVNLAFEVINRSAASVEILSYGSDSVTLRLLVKGPEVAVLTPRRLQTMELRRGRPITLAPGERYRVPIGHLAYGHRGDEERAYWTRPGTYSITATLVTAQRPAPPGAQADEQGFAMVTVTSNPIRVEVRGTRPRP